MNTRSEKLLALKALQAGKITINNVKFKPLDLSPQNIVNVSIGCPDKNDRKRARTAL